MSSINSSSEKSANEDKTEEIQSVENNNSHNEKTKKPETESQLCKTPDTNSTSSSQTSEHPEGSPKSDPNQNNNNNLTTKNILPPILVTNNSPNKEDEAHSPRRPPPPHTAKMFDLLSDPKSASFDSLPLKTPTFSPFHSRQTMEPSEGSLLASSKKSSLTDDSQSDISVMYAQLIQAVPLKDKKTVFNKVVKNCFSSEKAVSWLMKNTRHKSHSEAISFLKELKEKGYIIHYSGDERVTFSSGESLWVPLLATKTFTPSPISARNSPALLRKQTLATSPNNKIKFTASSPLPEICSAMGDQIEVKDRWDGILVHRRTFRGSDAVDWLVEKLTFVSERSEALQMGKIMIHQGLITGTTTGKKDFLDSAKALYRFNSSLSKLRDSADSPKGILTLDNNAFEQIGISYDQNQPRRKTMEDEHVTLDCFTGSPDSAYFAIYDGHGGRGCVDMISKILHPEILEERKKLNNLKKHQTWKECFEKAYKTCDNKVCETLREKKDTSGCTSVSIILEDDELKQPTLYIANIGDTRAVLVRDKQALRLTVDHNAGTNTEEVERIKSIGGFVFGKKVGGQLSVTRAFGNQHLKTCGVLSEPFYNEIKLQSGDTHLIVACDGLWDVVPDQKAVDILLKTDTAQSASDKLLKTALKNSTDNVSIVVVKFNVPEDLRKSSNDNRNN